MLLLRLAWRNLWRQRRRSMLTAGSMVVGFFLISISFGMMEGSYGQLIELFTNSFTGHLQIHANDYRDKPSLYKTLRISQLEGLEQLPFVESWTPRVYSGSLAFANERALGVGLIGLDYEREPATTTTLSRVSEGSFFNAADSQEVLVSYALAQRLKLSMDDELLLIGQGADGSIANDVYRVTGILGFKSDNDPSLLVYLPLRTAQEFLALGERVHEVAVMTRSYKEAEQRSMDVTAHMAQPTWDIQPWQVLRRSFYVAMQADQKSVWITVAIIMLIVGVGILNTVLMNLLERTREFGILKALGTRPGQLVRMIYLELTLLAAISVIIGSVVSVLGNGYLLVYGIKLSEPLQFGGVSFDTYRSVISADTIWIPAVLIFVSTWVVSFWPVYRLARMQALDALTHV